MFSANNGNEETQPNRETDQARSILGDESMQDAANAVADLNLIDPEEKQRKQREPGKRGRKPRGTVLPPESNGEPSQAEIVLGESIVEVQAISMATVVAMFSTPDSAAEIYKLHVEKHRQKLAYAFAKVAKEYGVEVTGKMAALAMLGSVEVGLLRECWDAWTPKETEA